jgi:hypothetical protein
VLVLEVAPPAVLPATRETDRRRRRLVRPHGARRRRRGAARGTPAGAAPALRGVRVSDDGGPGVRARVAPRGVGRAEAVDVRGLPADVARGLPIGVPRGLPSGVTRGLPMGVARCLPPDVARGVPVDVTAWMPTPRRRRATAGGCRAFWRRVRSSCDPCSGSARARGRHSTSSLPICWMGAQSSACAMRPSIDSRCRRSSLKTRTLINSCAARATSISCNTESVKPC